MGHGGGGGRPPLLRRRPQAVDLPVPAGRHRRVPHRRAIPRRRARAPHHQLPHGGARRRVGEPHVRDDDRRGRRLPARLPPPRPQPRGPPVGAALRSTAFGCGDEDLYPWKITHGGRWDHQAPVADGCPPEHPVARAVTWLAELHRNCTWLSPSEVVDTVVRERRLLEVAFVHPPPRDLWRRLRFVVDQARAWEEATGGSLRDYLTWVQLQSAESARVVETILPETDDESVRIMTVHGAKGLEFPITVLSGMTTALKGRRGGVEVRFPPAGGWAIKLGRGISTAEFDAYKP